jgi:hypothetical protein
MALFEAPSAVPKCLGRFRSGARHAKKIRVGTLEMSDLFGSAFGTVKKVLVPSALRESSLTYHSVVN